MTRVTGPGAGGESAAATQGIRSLLHRVCGIDLRAAAWPGGLPPWPDAFHRRRPTEVVPWPDAFRRTARPVADPTGSSGPVRRAGTAGPADRSTGHVRPWSEAFRRTGATDGP